MMLDGGLLIHQVNLIAICDLVLGYYEVEIFKFFEKFSRWATIEIFDISPVSNMKLWIFPWIFAWLYPKISACCSLRNLG